MRSILALVAALSALGTDAAVAANTITFKLGNATGKTLSVNSSYTTCSPNGSTCSIPSSISNNQTGTVTHTSPAGSTVGALLIVRYQYTDAGTTKSCQIQIQSSKSGTNCTSFNPTFSKMDGTASSPSCGSITTVTNDPASCEASFTAQMNN